jgi:hypothetical protein
MTERHPITPPPELMQQWYKEADSQLAPYYVYVATCAAQWGADQEFEAGTQLLDINGCPGVWIDMLRAARRPKSLSLKQQSLVALNKGCFPSDDEIAAIRRALEALPDDSP